MLEGLTKTDLRTALEEHFNREELEQLCADLQASLGQRGIDVRISLAVVGGDSYPAQVLNLVMHLERRNLLDDLANAIEQERPGILRGKRREPPTERQPTLTDPDGVITLVLVVTMCLVIVFVGAAVCALVWARIVAPIFLNLTLLLVALPAGLLWRRLSHRF
jgi:hypothetical protein